MTTVTVASGKGGAGKTSIAAALAASLGIDCLAVDCDVDAANGALALGGETLRREDYFAGPGYRIEKASCVGCGACSAACRFGAVRIKDEGARGRPGYEIVPELCERCGACLEGCRVGAVVSFEKKAGELFVSRTRLGQTLVHAELEPGEDGSGKLVRRLRERAEALAAADTFIVVDAPPGIGCPVIASLTGCDLVVVVVEASASGIRDAERLLELVSSMKRAAVGVVNKSGLDEAMDVLARAILERAGLPLAGEIPFDSSLRSVEECGRTWLDVAGLAGDQVRDALRAVEGALRAVAQTRARRRTQNEKDDRR